jgi:NADPH-dependent 7-cyano-7-deazaguanine reductase QueF
VTKIDNQYEYIGVLSGDTDFMIYASAGLIDQESLDLKYNHSLRKVEIFVNRFTPEIVSKALQLLDATVRHIQIKTNPIVTSSDRMFIRK